MHYFLKRGIGLMGSSRNGRDDSGCFLFVLLKTIDFLGF